MNCYVLSDPGPSLKEYNVLTWSGTDFNIHILSGLGTGLANSCIGSRQNRHWWKGRLTCRVRFRVFLFYITRVDDTIASKKRVWIFIKLNIINPFDMFDEGRHDLFTWYDVNGALKEGCQEYYLPLNRLTWAGSPVKSFILNFVLMNIIISDLRSNYNEGEHFQFVLFPDRIKWKWLGLTFEGGKWIPKLLPPMSPTTTKSKSNQSYFMRGGGGRKKAP